MVRRGSFQVLLLAFLPLVLDHAFKSNKVGSNWKQLRFEGKIGGMKSAIRRRSPYAVTEYPRPNAAEACVGCF